MVGVEDRDADFEVAKGKSELLLTWLRGIHAQGGVKDIREKKGWLGYVIVEELQRKDMWLESRSYENIEPFKFVCPSQRLLVRNVRGLQSHLKKV